MSTDANLNASKNRRQLPTLPTSKKTSSLLKSSISAGSLPSTDTRKVKDADRRMSQGAVLDATTKLLSSTQARIIVPPGTVPESEGEDSSVTVAVRVRPFSEREIKLGAQLAVKMRGKETSITSSEGVARKFCYDYSFWSFDRLRGDYSDQEAVYNQVAAPLLDQAFKGYNTCLFAYGQTGSGKSYCIMGEADNTGIVPRFAEELFSRIDRASTEEGESFKVEISFYEIYNEKIHDLLASTNKKNRTHLRVREHPVMGPYVEDLSTYVASSFKDIEHWITLGNKYRATAATGMNERSSRSHSVFTILFTQMSLLEGEEHSKVSRINLVDLAGSERSTLAQTSGDRLKEGANINRSLHTLGKVISLLAEKASNRRKKVFVPYRDSTLTWLLKESLGGNSKTTMIATISPADLYHDESLSTLRYAHQARSIINVAWINEDPSARVIRELRAEIERLSSLLGSNVNTPVTSQPPQLNGSHAADMEELRKKLRETEKLIADHSRTWEDRLLDSEKRKREEAEEFKKAGMSFKVDNKMPNLINLNEDPQLCEILVYALKEGSTSVGRQSSTSSCDIQLTGALIAPNHCEILNNSSVVSISPQENAQTYINGNLIAIPTVLHHGDRLVIGGEHYFRFNHPGELAEKGVTSQKSDPNDQKSFEYAYNEFVQAQTARIEAEIEEARLKEREALMQEVQAMKQQAQQELEHEKATYNQKLTSLECELEQHETKSKESAETSKVASSKIAELEEKNKKLEEETLVQRHMLQLEKMRIQKEDEEMRMSKTRLITELEEEKQRLEMEVRKMQQLKETPTKPSADTSLRRRSELLQVSMLIQEANNLSQTLNKHVKFSRDALYTNDSDPTLRVKLTNSHTGLNTIWDLSKFESRLVQMRELIQSGQDTESVCSSVSTMSEEDPFFDPKDVWEESFTSPSRGTPSTHRSNSLPVWSMSPSSSTKLLPDLPSSIPKHVTDALAFTKQRLELNASSPASETSSIASEAPNFTDVFQLLPSVPSLCRDRVNTLLTSLNENYTGVIQESVYHSVLMNAWGVSKAAGDMSMFLKSQLASHNNLVPLCESSDFRQTSISIQTSLELLVNSLYHLPRPSVSQSMDADLNPQHYRSKLTDVVKVLTTHIAQVLECIENEMESAIHNSVRSICDSVENVFSVCGQLSLAECTLHLLSGDQPLQEDMSWHGKLPFKILVHFYTGQCEYTEAVLGSIASSIELKAIGEHTEGASDVVTCVNQLINAIANLIQQMADTQDQMWPSVEDQDEEDYQSALNAPSLNYVTEMLALAYKVMSHVTKLCDTTSTQRIDCDQLKHCNTDTAGTCTQLAASVLNVIKSSGCQQDNILTGDIQTLSREIMRAGKNLNHAAKKYGQQISYRVGMSMATGQVTSFDDGII